MNKGKELLSNLKFYESYSKYRDDLGRKETWEESVDSVMEMHYEKFKHLTELTPYLDSATQSYKNKQILASQRNLQFRGDSIKKHNVKLFNCSSTYIDRPEVFKQIMYILLNGCGVGYSVEKRFVENLPTIKKRNDNTVTHIIEDSVEGWAISVDTLLMSFFDGSSQIRFDGSLIRPEGAFISGGFKAPGYEPLRKSLELIENLLNNRINSGQEKLTTLDCHDIICHIADAVLSGGIRRSALIALFDKDDELMLKCKTGNWFYDNPQRGRANNSVKLLKGNLTKEEFYSYKESIKEFGEPGVVLVDDLGFCTNPCAEIGFIPINPNNGKSCISFCNLNEVNGGQCTTPAKFYEACRNAAILGTLQASYTDMPFLGKDTKELIEWEALIGVSITGIMDNPKVLLNPEVLRKGAEIVNKTNEEVAKIIGINPAARTTTVKPSGNASVILGTSSGIHPSHSKRYFRIMQMNKQTEVAKVLNETNSVLLENSVWSASGNDYAVYIPIEENEGAVFKENVSDIDFVEAVEIVYQNWVIPGNHRDRGYSNKVTHNVSNTITVSNWDILFEHLFKNKNSFCGLSFMPSTGDKVYKQSPFTKVLSYEDITNKYGTGSLFASGLIVDSLHAFDNDLWDACQAVVDRTFGLSGDRYKVLLKKDVVRRIKKFAKSYFKNDLTMDEKQELLDVIEDYHRGIVPLMVPIILLRHYAKKYDRPYLRRQVYLNNHPAELMPRNHV